jgi:hypothetical protein
MREKRTEIVKVQGVVRTIPSHQQLMKVNQMLMGAVIFLMLVLFIVGLVIIPDADVTENYAKINATRVAAQGMNPVVSAEVNKLKGQLIGMVSGSIESKLRSLEESIKLGTVNHSLGTIEDLKNDIKVLRTYSETPKKDQASMSNQELAKEVTHLKGLIYMSLVSCGLMFVGAAGIWVKYRKRLPHIDVKSGFLGKR